MPASTADQRAISDLGKLLLGRAAAAEPAVSAELELFPVLSTAYFQDRNRALTGTRSGGVLKFGVDEATILLTPVMLEAARSVWEYLVQDTARRGIAWSAGAVRRLFDVPAASDSGAVTPGPAETPALTAAQWTEVHRIVTGVLTGPGRMAPARAGFLADAVVGRGRLAEAGDV